MCSADVSATRRGREEWFTSVTVLSPDGEINRELTRRSRTSGIRVGWRAEGSRNVVRVREISSKGADRPPNSKIKTCRPRQGVLKGSSVIACAILKQGFF